MPEAVIVATARSPIGRGAPTIGFYGATKVMLSSLADPAWITGQAVVIDGGGSRTAGAE